MTDTLTNSSPKDVWADDLLGRRDEADLIKSYLLRRLDRRRSLGKDRTFVLNVDAPWGAGKSFFLCRLREQLANDGYLVAQVNAWEDDHAEDPLLTVLSAIDDVTSPFTQRSQKAKAIWQNARTNGGKIALSLVAGAAKTFGRHYLGAAVDEVTDLLRTQQGNESAEAAKEVLTQTLDDTVDSLSNGLIEKFKETKKTITDFRTCLSGLIRELAKEDSSRAQLFVFVDELDRCRPNYALSLLERIKHLFNTDGLVFILATDTSQLRHSIRAIYGNEFDSERYLLRFFDRDYHLRTASLAQVANVLFKGFDKTWLGLPITVKTPEEYFAGLAETFELTIRDLEQSFEIFSDISLMRQKSSTIEMAYLVPLIFLRLKKRSEFLHLKTDSLTASEFKTLQELMSWRTKPFPSGDDSPPVAVSAWDLFERFWRWSGFDARKLSELQRSEHGAAGEWVLGRFAAEMQTMHGGGYNSNRPPRFSFRNYIECVESISALSS